MLKICTNLVLKLLNDDQREHHKCVTSFSSLFKLNQTFFVELFTVDVTLIFCVVPVKQAAKQSVEVTDVTETEESKSKSKVMMITFFNAKDIVHCEFLPQMQSFNRQVYKRTRRDEIFSWKNRGCFNMAMHLLINPLNVQ